MVMETAVSRRQHRGGDWRRPTGCSPIEPNNARALATKGLIQVAGLAAARIDRRRRPGARRASSSSAPSTPRRTIPWRSRLIIDSFVTQGVLPPDDAQNALYTAMELAPSDGELRYQLARDFEQRHMIPRGDRDHPAGRLSGARIAATNPKASAARASEREAARAPGRARSGTRPRSKCSPGSRRGSADGRQRRRQPAH